MNEQALFSLEVAKKINAFVSYNESLDWGVVRYGNVGIHGVKYRPSIPIEAEVASQSKRFCPTIIHQQLIEH